VSRKLVSLFEHPAFARRAQARAQRELAERVLPVERLSASRMRCRRCSLEYSVMPRLPGAELQTLEACPRCEPARDLDALEVFLSRLFSDD
jgi:hypothetical protein